MGISEVVQGNLEVYHRCSGFEPLWVRGTLPDNACGRNDAPQRVSALPGPPGYEADAPLHQFDLQPRGLAPRAHALLPRQAAFAPSSGDNSCRADGVGQRLGSLARSEGPLGQMQT